MTSTTKDNGTQTFDSAFEQLKEAGEQLAGSARKAGNLYLDTYEQAVDRTIELELEFAGLTEQEWLKEVIAAQADIARYLNESFISTARSLLG